MARKSRIVTGIDEKNNIELAMGQTIGTAVYARKSHEDDSSLENQIAMLMDYVNDSEDLVLYKVYSDNGFTGTNFDRPAFKQMIIDMKAGMFQAIVVKDGSRLGRNYLEAGAYMESLFPAYGIRFISLNDHYDSADIKCEKDGISVPLRNIMNEQYSKDLSRKLTSAFRTKQLNGEYIGANAPYGYRKADGNCNQLVVDEETAPVVKRIFCMKIEGVSDGKIAQTLNEEDILSPFAYRYKKRLVKAEKYRTMIWRRGTISQMLKNQMYLGHMVQGVHRQSLSRREEQYKAPQNEWIIVKDTHEAIISVKIFDRVQDIVEKRRVKFNNILTDNEKEPTLNLFRGKIYCADCNRAMTIGISRTKRATHFYYRCRSVIESNGHKCVQRSVKKEVVETTVFEIVKSHMNLFTDSMQYLQQENGSETAIKKSSQLKSELNQLKAEKARYIELVAGLYKDYTESLLDQEEYIYASGEYKEKISDIDARLSLQEELIKSYGDKYVISKEWDDRVLKLGKAKELSQEMVDAFISRVIVYQDGQLGITLNCMDQFQKTIQLAKQRAGDFNAKIK